MAQTPVFDKVSDLGTEYKKLSESVYEFTLARNEQKVLVSISEEDIIHATGLYHLDDVGRLGNNDCQVRISTLNNIINGYYPIPKLQTSANYTQGLSNTYNSQTGSRCTIEERILKIGNITSILDSAGSEVEIYQHKASKIELPDGAPDKNKKHKYRDSKINADYMLVLPYKANPNDDEKIYLFTHLAEPAKKDKPIKLLIHSAFTDCVDLTQGQLKQNKVIMTERFDRDAQWHDIGNRCTLYINPSYQNSLIQRAAEQKRVSEITDYAKSLENARNECEKGNDNADIYFDALNDFLSHLQTPKDCETARKILLAQLDSKHNETCQDEIKDELQLVSDKKDAILSQEAPSVKSFHIGNPHTPNLTNCAVGSSVQQSVKQAIFPLTITISLPPNPFQRIVNAIQAKMDKSDALRHVRRLFNHHKKEKAVPETREYITNCSESLYCVGDSQEQKLNICIYEGAFSKEAAEKPSAVRVSEHVSKAHKTPKSKAKKCNNQIDLE